MGGCNRLYTGCVRKEERDLTVLTKGPRSLELQPLCNALQKVSAKTACEICVQSKQGCDAVTHSGNAMLASSCLGYDSLFAHAPAKESLAEGVIDLVRSCMVQVFPLQVNLWSTIFAVCRHNHNGTQLGDGTTAEQAEIVWGNSISAWQNSKL